MLKRYFEAKRKEREEMEARERERKLQDAAFWTALMNGTLEVNINENGSVTCRYPVIVKSI